ncbi:Tetracycline resistance protein TetA/multidrug resistance protein MdtG [Penicillium odoratum]|uniref:Tetracycline resistance protein TetA/multidrug resistance protein MdtG n=1 Tax=Penicillium odoratum TaxID=1167516 RepID=UPI00254709C3|nr:Tetracycline resistance protein TetA/multidrug resistance protein MdtG [Penicillium odoratum]KAJ5764813.1 Tetracycline resistance protein TetA/multidrug resistance protein MdtG [Penicillium odoratum]
MSDLPVEPIAIGFKWRSSKWFILSTVTIALFGETFLYGFIIPILGYMVQSRLKIDPDQAQRLTSAVLALHGAVSVVAGPIIGHFADRTPNRKIPLLLSVLSCIIGTIMIAGTHSVTILLLGRVLQGVATSAVWIVSLATIADMVGQQNLGAIMGLTMSFVNLGTIGGPAASGLLLEAVGYWVTWLIPLLILAVDLVARLVMIECPKKDSSTPTAEAGEAGETASLLSATYPPVARNFWRIMLSDARVLTVLLVVISGATVGTSFAATLPIHVQETFGWGPRRTGLAFSCLVIPAIIIAPLAGWVRDRVGSRPPAVISLVLQAGFLGLLGVAGSDRITWARANHQGGTVYVACILALSALRPFMSCIGPVELSAAVKAHQEKSPGIFGSEGGLSRVFSMMEVAASLGMTIGPIVSGLLKENLGYACMSWTLSKSYPVFM